MEREEVAKKLGLTFQQVRWAEESAIKKLRDTPELREVLRQFVQANVWDGVEIEEKYCEIVAEQLSQKVLNFSA